MVTTERSLLSLVRKALLGIFLFGVVGTGAELILLEHTEDFWQWTPLVLMGLGAAVLILYTFVRSSGVLRAFQGAMALCVASGLLGIWFQYQGNVEFELEMYPTIGGVKLFWEAMKGATPALAPGTMIQLGLLGLLFTYRHPVFRGASNQNLT
jgi:hypothetical protein